MRQAPPSLVSHKPTSPARERWPSPVWPSFQMRECLLGSLRVRLFSCFLPWPLAACSLPPCPLRQHPSPQKATHSSASPHSSLACSPSRHWPHRHLPLRHRRLQQHRLLPSAASPAPASCSHCHPYVSCSSRVCEQRLEPAGPDSSRRSRQPCHCLSWLARPPSCCCCSRCSRWLACDCYASCGGVCLLVGSSGGCFGGYGCRSSRSRG